MPHFDWKILPFLFLLSFCKNRQSSDNQLIVCVGQASLRAESSEKSREIGSLRKGQVLTDLGEVGQSEAQIAVGEELFQTPWIKVQTSENQAGWVLAWAVRPTSETTDWLLQKRLLCYFGKTFAERRNILMKDFEKLETAQQMAITWHEAITLRDTCLMQLSRRPEAGIAPQFNWLDEMLPGFLFQKIGEAERPYLFADFLPWYKKALKTNGLQDDAFFQTCLVAFPQDSIESFSPVWKFPLSDSESASQLGAGQHLKMLRQIDLALEAGPLFAPRLEAFKEEVLEDVFGKNVRYWQPKEKILEELSQILARPPRCLNEREREALSIRQKMFENPVENGIVLNLRSGG